MTEHLPERDPRSRFEDEGIPDLQDGTPQQQWAEDPQEAPLPGDRPVGVDEYGTTAAEQATGEPLGERLDREEPEEQPVFGAEETAAGEESREDAGTEDSTPAGRLVAPDEGAHEDAEKDEVADDVGADLGGYTAEESAMRVEPE